MAHRAGFVSIVGRPNAGKSTLMNRLVGERLSAMSPKAQTTRHRILGIFNDVETQIVLSDTPGIIDPAYLLHQGMMDAVSRSVNDADALVCLAELGEDPEESPMKRMEHLHCPVLVVLNKCDLHAPEKVNVEAERWKSTFPSAEVIVLSALKGDGTDALLARLRELMPEHPPYFDKDELTDRPVRFFVGEAIREKMLLLYKKEVPYSVEVVVEEYKEGKDGIDRIMATVFCERESQKQIIIGRGGEAIKRLGIEARGVIEQLVGRQVHLALSVKVRKDWRSDPLALKRFGYLEK